MQNFLRQIWLRLSEPRSLRFLVVGILGAITNILLLEALVDCLDWETTFLRSLANIMATEICLVASFFAYRQIVWQMETISWPDVLCRELPRYHLSIAWVIIIRIFLLFPLLDWLGLHHTFNTMLGISLGAVLSYILNDKLVFNVQK
jgi:dolichol-phosphate mannosyltransferase